MSSRYDLHPIYILAPPYHERSGGIRALYRLCHHLNKAGFHAFMVSSPYQAPSSLEAPPLAEEQRQEHLSRGCKPIGVCGECEIGNPLDTSIVVRYLLNTPGWFQPLAPSSFGDHDFFLHFDDAHVPAERRSIDLFMPVVNRTIYHLSEHQGKRHGYLLLSHRAALDKLEPPSWVRPLVTVTMENPLAHEELARLYRRCRAMITLERGVAIFESLCCGCPVICIPGPKFTPETYQRRFRGAGLAWGWSQVELATASARTGEFLHLYQKLERGVTGRVHQVFNDIIDKASQRSRLMSLPMLRAAS